MKNLIIYRLLSATLVVTVLVSCSQEKIKLTNPTTTTPTPVTPSKGSADFTKYVSIGNSLTSGFQAGALFTEGQNNSFPSILSKQFSLAQGTTLTFNQPDINSVNGYSNNMLPNGSPLGRFVLFYVNGSPIPTPAGYPGVPAPYNTADIPTPYTGDKTKLNNFGVPGILLGQVLDPRTGGPANTIYFNGLYARFASAPGTSTILGDAIATSPSFFTFDLGNNDVLGYATTGGDGSIPITTTTDFTTFYTGAISSLMTKTTAKGVVGTIPSVVTIPFFQTVQWNPIPLTSLQVGALTSAFAGYNQVLQGLSATLTAMPGIFGLDAAHAAPIIAELATRSVTFSVSATNKILIVDETLIDLGPFFDGLAGNNVITSAQRTALTPYQQVRQTTANDLITLRAGSILGTTVGGNDLLVNGVSVPLEDKYVLIPSEIAAINTATDSYNATIKSIAANYPDRLAVADLYAAFGSLVTNKVITIDGVTITPTFAPPTGAFSEDGVHPNSRGYAYMANVFIDAINAKFGATVPKAKLSDYKGTGLPVGTP